MKKVLVAQYGCGKMSEYLMRYVYENGGQIVAAFDVDEAIIGKDIGEIMGISPKKVKVEHVRYAAERLGEKKPNVCLIATKSLLRDVEDAFRICAEQGVNALSLCEEAFYPWNSSPYIAESLDRLAKENNCTLAGTGYQDIFWCNLITTIAGACDKMTKVKGISSYNVEDYGIALARAHGVGLTEKEFKEKIAAANEVTEAERQRKIEEGDFLPAYMWNVNGWLAAEWRLEIKSQIQTCIPQIAKRDMESQTLGMTVPKGHVAGMSARVVTETKEGIVLETECIGKLYAPGECDVNDWTIYGEPETRVVIERPHTVELTCATMVNRIPDIINAEPGYVTTNWLPVNRFRPHPLAHYVEDEENDFPIYFPQGQPHFCDVNGVCH